MRLEADSKRYYPITLLDQIIVGSLQGTLTVLDPARNVDQRQEMSLLIQLQLKSPVLQVSAGRYGSSKFLSADNQLLIAALHPHSIVYFQLKQSASSSDEFILESILENKIAGPPAFNFCQVGGIGAVFLLDT